MALEPKPGLVIRYDFLWKDDEAAGLEEGRKDRPCAIILVAKPKSDESRDVILCAITHSPPDREQSAVEIPIKVARHLGLDSDRCWIKTHEVNTVVWPKDRIPFGVAKLNNGEWIYGQMPKALSENVFNQVRERSQSRNLENVRREDYLTEALQELERGGGSGSDNGNEGRGR